MKVLVYSQRDKSQVLELPGHEYSPQEKMKRALSRLGIFWGLAVLSVLAPVVHFVLVPAFLLIGPFIAYKTYQEEAVIEEVTIKCPECNTESRFQKNSGQWPLHNNCDHCRNRVYFERA